MDAKSEEATEPMVEKEIDRGDRMDQSRFLSDACFWLPEHTYHPLGWAGHIPFAFRIVEASRPAVFVELGTHAGDSYFAFCQAVKKLELSTRCHAIDCWEGDEHAGFYGEEIFQAVDQKNRCEYGAFSRLIRTRFDEAAPLFEQRTIDLLHIDGLHTYEAVKHDFENWLPKMSRRGIILLHDTNVYVRNFGVYRLFEEQASRYPTFQFLHSHGLGIIGVGSELPEEIITLFEASRDEPRRDSIRACYERLGQALLQRAAYKELEDHAASLESHLARSQQTEIELQQMLVAASQYVESLKRHIEELNQQKSTLETEKSTLETECSALLTREESTADEIAKLRGELAAIQQSLGWMLLNRARRIRDRVIDVDTTPGRCWAALTGLFKSAAG